MNHGPHDNCMMCKMARVIGMMEKHPENCDCQSIDKLRIGPERSRMGQEKREDEHHKHEETVHEHAHAA